MSFTYLLPYLDVSGMVAAPNSVQNRQYDITLLYI